MPIPRQLVRGWVARRAYTPFRAQVGFALGMLRYCHGHAVLCNFFRRESAQSLLSVMRHFKVPLMSKQRALCPALF